MIDKAHWFSNTVTGEMFKVHFDEAGNSIVRYVGKRSTLPGVTGQLVRDAYQVVPTPYAIKNGKLVTMIGNTPFEMAIYKLGDQYYGARSNEFGYANYELLAKGPNNLVDLGKGEYDKESQSSFLHSSTSE